MRILLRSAPCAFMVMGSHALAQGLELDATSYAPAAERNVPASGVNPVAHEENGIAPSADVPDPFASGNPAPAKEVRNSHFTLLPLNFIYQGSYIPRLISDQGRDQTVHDLFLDSTLNWAASGSAMLKARVLFEGQVEKAQSEVSHSSDISGLEYFYEQRFGNQSQTLTIGRKYLGWSSGYQWRPADLIENGFATKNIEIQDPNRYLGVDQVRYELNQSGFNIDAILSDKDKRFYGGDQFAMKLGRSGAVDFSLMYARNGDYSRKYGLTLDAVLPWSTSVAVEAVHIDINKNLLSDPLHFGMTLESLSGISRFEDVYVSLTKFMDDKRRVNLDFFHNGRGFENAIPEAPPVVAGNEMPSYHVDPSIFSDQYLGRNYAYLAYTGYVDGWKLQWKPSLLMNLGDHSYIGSISINRVFGGRSELTLNLSSYNGDGGTEFGSISRGVGVSVSYVLPIL